MGPRSPADGAAARSGRNDAREVGRCFARFGEIDTRLVIGQDHLKIERLAIRWSALFEPALRLLFLAAEDYSGAAAWYNYIISGDTRIYACDELAR